MGNLIFGNLILFLLILGTSAGLFSGPVCVILLFVLSSPKILLIILIALFKLMQKIFHHIIRPQE